jgi:hypothetical protein
VIKECPAGLGRPTRRVYGLWQVWTTVLQRTAPPFKYCSRSCRANSNACSRAASPACRAAATTRVHCVSVYVCLFQLAIAMQVSKYNHCIHLSAHRYICMYAHLLFAFNHHACCFSLSPFLTPCVCLHPASSTHRIVVVKKGRVLDVTFVLLPAAVLAHIKVRCWMPQPVEYSQRQQPTKQQSATTKQQRMCAPPPLPHTHHCAPVQVALELVAQKCLATASCGGNRGHGHDSSSCAQANITQQQQQHNIAQQHRAYASVSAMPNQILQPLTQANEDDSETLLLQSDALALDVAADEELVRVCGRARSCCCRRAFAPPPTHIQ